MSNEEIIINFLLLKGYLGNFELEKRNFENLTYSNFNSSYIKTCSDKYVSQMNGKLTDLYNQIKMGYKSIYDWWILYNNNVEMLESILSSDGRNSSSLESNIQVIVNILPLLEDYDISLSGFTEPFSIGEGINIENIQLSGILVAYVIDEKTTIMIDKNLIPILEQQLKEYNELILSLDETSIQLTAEREKYQIAMGTFMTNEFWNEDTPSEYKMQYNPTDEELRIFTEDYNKKLLEVMGELGISEITSFEQLEEKIKLLSTEISSISNSQYYVRQTIKSLPYNYIKQNDDFNEYGNYSDYKNIEYTESWITRTRTYDFKINGQTLSSVNYLALAQLALEDEEFKKKFVVNNRYSYNQSGQIIDSKLKEAMESLNYISVDELKLYNYLFDKQGQVAANAYLKSIEDNINQRKGIVEASEFLYYLNDGGKFSQFIETTFEGTADGVETFFEGLENVVNASGVKSDTQYKQMIILQALSDQLNNEDFIKMCKESGCYEEILKVVNQNTLNLDGKSTFNQITEEYGDYGKVLSLTYNVGNTFGNMLPAMVTAMMTSALATPMVGAKVGEVLASVGSSTFMGVSAGGNAANQMLIEGRTSQQAIAFGILTGLSEATLQYFLGNIPGINQKAKLALKEILEEGLEEGIQSVLGRVFKSWSTSEPIDLDGLSQEVATSFVMGCLISGMTTGGQTLIKYGGTVFSLNSEQLTNIMNSENPMKSLSEYVSNNINPPIQKTSYTNENTMGYIKAEKASENINNAGYKLKTKNKNYEWIFDDINDSGYVPQELGNYLEENFCDSDYIYGVHATNSGRGIAESIMQKGFRLSGDNSSCTFSSNIDLSKNFQLYENTTEMEYAKFIRNLKFAHHYKPDGTGSGDAIIIKIPKSDYNNLTELLYYENGFPYLKPEYVMGYVSTHNGNLSQFNYNKSQSPDNLSNINASSETISPIHANEVIEEILEFEPRTANSNITEDLSNTLNENIQSIMPSEEFIVSDMNDPDATLKKISINILLEIIKNDETYAKFLDFSNNKYFFKYSLFEYANAMTQLIDACNTNGYDIGLNENQQERARSIIQNYTIENYSKNLKKLFFNKYQQMVNYGGGFSQVINEQDLTIALNSILEQDYQKFLNSELNKYCVSSGDLMLESIIYYMREYKNIIFNNIILNDIEVTKANLDIILNDIFKNEESTINSAIIDKIISKNIDIGDYNFNKIVGIILNINSLYQNINQEKLNYINFYLNEGYYLDVELSKAFNIYKSFKDVIINLEKIFGSYVNNIKEKTENSLVLLNDKTFSRLYSYFSNVVAFNNGVNSIFNIKYDMKFIFGSLHHESLHQLSFNSVNRMSGLRAHDNNGNKIYIGINEAITEYFAILSAGEAYSMADSQNHSSYAAAVSRLMELIELDVMDLDTLKQIYFTNDIERFKKIIENSLPLVGFENFMKAFDKAISSDINIRNEGLNMLDKIIIMLRMNML